MKVMIAYEQYHDRVIGAITKTEILKEAKIQMLPICDGSKPYEYMDEYDDFDPDYLITLDMAGFQLNSLTNSFFYNLRRAKQMHLVLDERFLPLYDKGQFALNMYLFLPECEINWKERYPDIINLFTYRRFDNNEEEIRKKIESMIDYVISDSHCMEKAADFL